MELTRTQERTIRALANRQGRRKSEVFAAEGLRCCAEALRRRPGWLAYAVVSEDFADEALLAALAATGKPVARVAARAFAELALTESPQGVLCVLRRPDTAATAPVDPFVLVLDRVADPGNVGTILRTAWAVGLRRVAITKGTADPYAPKTVRAGMGAQFAVDVETHADLAAARAHHAAAGYTTLWLTAPLGEADCFDATFDLRRSLLVLGNEAAGVDPTPDARTVRIPMPGTAESLNVAQAATILLFDAVRRGTL
jgi:TrmH family RNA methyltransferase